jgi:2-oxoglutarate ferredoxin oxidoreductase subunit beta
VTIETYIDRDRMPYPFCPGCSHGHVLDRLDEAMVRLQLDPAKVVVVTDIGCVGLSDQWFKTHSFHGLHGRSVVYGEGLKLASPELHVIVLTGDGGAGIGLHHLLNAAKRNVGVTVILFNNMSFGMTGGEHSITTPEGAVTSTTVAGHFESPLRLCETLQANLAPFVARRAYYDDDIVDVMAKAIAFDGFAFVEVMEFCVAYYVPMNKFDRKGMEALLTPDKLPRLVAESSPRTEFGTAYREYSRRMVETGIQGRARLGKRFAHGLSGNLAVVIAGSAGMKISSTASLFARAGILSGLHALQRDDYPVTVQSGHSVSFVKLSRFPIGYLGIEKPDVLLILSKEGLAKAMPYSDAMTEGQRVYVLDSLPEVDTRAQVTRVSLEGLKPKPPKEFIALSVLSTYLASSRIFPREALELSIGFNANEKLAEKQLRFVQASNF